MAIQFKCPACGQAYSVPEQSTGRSAKCKACGNAIVVPGASAGPPKPAQKPPAAPAKPPQKPTSVPAAGGAGKMQTPDRRAAMEKTFEKVAAVASGGVAASGGDARPAARAASSQAALHALKCASCGGKVDLQNSM